MESTTPPIQGDRFTQALAAQEIQEQQEKIGKRCSSCGRILPLDHFHRASKRKDGYACVCKDCKKRIQHTTISSLKNAKERIKELESQIQSLQGRNSAALKDCTPRQLIDELSRRGYKGELTYVQHIKL
jgi:uncharacterized protein YlaI